MKKKLILAICIVVLVSTGFAQQDAKKAAMDSFMGAKWGISATQLEKTFKHGDLIGTMDGFHLFGFMLGEEMIPDIVFQCTAKGDQPLDFDAKNYDNLYFRSVMMTIVPSQFKALFEVFKAKYGEPTSYNESTISNRLGAKFPQIEAIWKNDKIKRQIIIRRLDEKIDQGRIYLIPMETDADKAKKAQKAKKAASIL